MIDLTENTIIFTLNGEVLMSDSGSETAFREIELGDGEHEILSPALPNFPPTCLNLHLALLPLVLPSLP
jgi:hypothetical protein